MRRLGLPERMRARRLGLPERMRVRRFGLPVLMAVVGGCYLLFPVLPFQDWPAHAGLLALRERLEGSPFLSAHFERGSWVGPYGLFLGLGQLLAGPLGPELAMRVIAALATLALPCALLAARRDLLAARSHPGAGLSPVPSPRSAGEKVRMRGAPHERGRWPHPVPLHQVERGPGSGSTGSEVLPAGARDPGGAVDRWGGAGYLGLVLGLGFSTALGLSSFLLGLATLVLAVPRWMAVLRGMAVLDGGRGGGGWGRFDRWRGEAWVALFGVVVAFGHGFAFVLLALIAGTSLLVMPRGWARPLRSLWALLPGAAFLAWAWWRDRGFYAPPEVSPLVQYAGWSDKLALPFLPTLLTRSGADAIVAIALWLLLGWAVKVALKAGGRAADLSRVVLARTAVVLAALALVVPTRIGWFGSIDLRLCTTALLLAVLVADPPRAPPRLRRLLERGPPWLAATMTALLAGALALFQAEARGPVALLDRVPAGARLLYLPLESGSRVWAARPFLHLDKRLLLDRDVLPGDLWLHPATALRLRPAAPPSEPPTALSATTGSSQASAGGAAWPLSARSTWGPQPLRLDVRGAVDWAAYDLSAWDHVLLRAGGQAPGAVPAALEPVASGGGLLLYRRRAISLAGPPAAGGPAAGARRPGR